MTKVNGTDAILTKVGEQYGIAINKNSDGKYVATDKWYADITQDGMAFSTLTNALTYAQLKRRLYEAKSDMDKVLNKIGDMIQAENLEGELN